MNLPGNVHFRLVSYLRKSVKTAPARYINPVDLVFRSTDDFNGAQCKAVCVEAGMIALRREATVVTHEDFMDAILEVQAKKKQTLNYYA